MNGASLYFAVLVPLAVILIIALFFYRLFSKNMKKDDIEREKIRTLEELKKLAEFKDARIISVHPEGQSQTSPSNRFVSLRFEIKDTSGELKMFSARWFVDTLYLSQLQPDSRIQVKVYDEFVFPMVDGSRLYT